jgi:hypothetical protein
MLAVVELGTHGILEIDGAITTLPIGSSGDVILADRGADRANR